MAKRCVGVEATVAVIPTGGVLPQGKPSARENERPASVQQRAKNTKKSKTKLFATTNFDSNVGPRTVKEFCVTHQLLMAIM